MMARPIKLNRAALRGKRVRLRAAVLHYGSLLGWQTQEVIAFAEALTGCPWRRCGCDELVAVLDEYLSIMDVIQGKAARRHLAVEKGGEHETVL